MKPRVSIREVCQIEQIPIVLKYFLLSCALFQLLKINYSCINIFRWWSRSIVHQTTNIEQGTEKEKTRIMSEEMRVFKTILITIGFSFFESKMRDIWLEVGTWCSHGGLILPPWCNPMDHTCTCVCLLSTGLRLMGSTVIYDCLRSKPFQINQPLNMGCNDNQGSAGWTITVAVSGYTFHYFKSRLESETKVIAKYICSHVNISFDVMHVFSFSVLRTLSWLGCQPLPQTYSVGFPLMCDLAMAMKFSDYM